MSKFSRPQLRNGVMIGPREMIQLIPWTNLELDPAYQRFEIPGHTQKLVREFDEEKLGTFYVGRRKKRVRGGGKDYLTDAQHRLRAIRFKAAKGEKVPKEVRCIVTLDTTQAEEAEQFATHNDGKAVQGNARFKARLVYKCRPETDIVRWLKTHGFQPDFRSAGGPSEAEKDGNGVYSMAVLRNAYNVCTTHIDGALQFIKLVYGKAHYVPWGVRSGTVIAGIARFLKDAPEKDVTKLAKRFRAMRLDLAAGVEDCREEDKDSNGSRNAVRISKLIADWLYSVMCNGGSRRRAA